jgi:hypothetical protein
VRARERRSRLLRARHRARGHDVETLAGEAAGDARHERGELGAAGGVERHPRAAARERDADRVAEGVADEERRTPGA